MAITLNGSTGIVEANIADNAITTNKIASGAVAAGDLASTLDLSGKTVTLPTSVAGKVFQTKVLVDNTNISTTSTSYQNIWSDISITMTGNNKLLVMAFVSGIKFGNSDARGTFKLFIDGSASTELARDWGYTLTDPRMTQSVAIITPQYSSGATKTINVKYASVDGGSIQINGPYSGAGVSTLIVQEVAP